MKLAEPIRNRLTRELDRHRDAARSGDVSTAWHALELSHILAQPELGSHLRVHLAMLAYAVRLGQTREITGQIFRIALAPLGALTDRTPIGNSGRASVSAFQPMTIPVELMALISGGDES